ncbi:MAG: cobamide remodeling phosphodiesterase CbiR [Deltaproteobacteria bacterium]|jgi:sugar phosphate isomerase/epimerase|nr:cobamide remodeling phosphodiesterase CbiR [Deltaproteobacteria bacterium]
MVNDNFNKKGGLNFGVNTDSFFGIGFGLLGDNNPGRLQASFDDFFNLLNSYKIGNIEINTEIEQLNPGSLQKFIIPSISAFSSKLPVPLSVSVHLPYLQLNPASPLEEYRQVSVKAMSGVINACRGLDVKKFVIHLTSEFEDSIMFFPIEEKAKKVLIDIAARQAKKSISDILKETKLPPAVFALENLEVFPFDYLYPIVEEFGISVCFDMGHWGLNGFKPEDFLKKFGINRIGEMHIQDMSEKRTDLRTTVRNEHRPLGTGILNPAGFFSSLIENERFSGPLIIENRSKEDLISSLDYLKSGNFI